MGEGGQPMVQSIDEARQRQRSGGRVPPHNLEAEESLLGAMLLSNDAVAAAVVSAVDRAEALVYEVAQQRVTDSMADISGVLNATLDHIEALYERGESITGLPTGYLDLDEVLAGLQPSSLVIVGARPAMGKTSFGL